ncbi:unnamed protein product [Microthlaspi erraticum]|uniref:Glycerol-3-phosphate acyltransferase RAM2/GPAT1-8 HAD-like domain-containing protein n=1 Tax=Microthlaspi erraticum TaxID=1685480 RepID=A0A6D2L9L7_9BRAS|nr:unnamed protein product [Microthlaspi erraticum]CAA7061568.1 unnamed protein product [Microthlaspi erraticum]
METSRTTPYSVVSEFEGALLKNKDSFSYFMLLAFVASGLIRFTILLFLWPIIKLLDVFSYQNAALKLMVFVAMVGLRERVLCKTTLKLNSFCKSNPQFKVVQIKHMKSK